MFHTHPALVGALRADVTRTIRERHGVPGDDFDGVVPRTTRPQRRAARRRLD
jgi:hypothetical protein